MKALRYSHDKLAIDSGRRHCLKVSLGLGAIAGMSAAAAREPGGAGRLVWQQRLLQGFGTSLWLRAAHHEAAHLRRALDAAVKVIRHVERELSLFAPDSAVSRLNRTGELRRPDPDLVTALTLARSVSDRSAGAFDVTIQPLWQTWARAQADNRLPNTSEMRRAIDLTNWRELQVTAERVSFNTRGMAVTLNGLAQGYAADRARDVLAAHDIEHALLDTGEWMPMGRGPQRDAWRLGLVNPHATDELLATVVADSRPIATSSDASFVFTKDRRHHHILDPRLGQSPASIASVSVAAPSAALADALTKVMFMGSVEQAINLAASWEVDVFAAGKDGAWQASPGMPLAGQTG